MQYLFCDLEKNYEFKDIFSCFTQTKSTNFFGIFIIILLLLLHVKYCIIWSLK